MNEWIIDVLTQGVRGTNRDKLGRKKPVKNIHPTKAWQHVPFDVRVMVFSPSMERYQAIPELPRRPLSTAMLKLSRSGNSGVACYSVIRHYIFYELTHLIFSHHSLLFFKVWTHSFYCQRIVFLLLFLNSFIHLCQQLQPKLQDAWFQEEFPGYKMGKAHLQCQEKLV